MMLLKKNFTCRRTLVTARKQHPFCPVVHKRTLKYFGVCVCSQEITLLYSRGSFIFICVRVRRFCVSQRRFSFCSCNYLRSDYGQRAPIKIGNILKRCCRDNGRGFETGNERGKYCEKFSTKERKCYLLTSITASSNR